METPTVTNGNGKKTKLADKTPKEEAINLLPISIVNTTVTVVGTSSLIVHAWSAKAKKEMRDKQTGKERGKKAAKVPEDDFRGAMYLDVNGNHCVPALAFKNAIVSAARFSDDYKMTVLRGAIFIPGTNRAVLEGGEEGGLDLLPIEGPPPVMREDMVRVGMAVADLRYRPEYRTWAVHLPIQFNNRVISMEQVYNLVQVAGFSVGICEWRPEKNGQHGRFELSRAGIAMGDAE